VIVQRSVGGLVALLALAGCGRLHFEDVPGDDGGGDLLTLDPAIATINLGSQQQLTAAGGSPPYRFDLTGEGWIDPMLGLYRAPSQVGQTTVRVTDAAGATATAEVDYRGSTIFVVGGLIGVNASTSVYASPNGINWTNVGSIPAARNNGALVVWDDRLLYLGGGMMAGSSEDNIYVSTDGATWTLAGTLPERVTSTSVLGHDGALWMIGGYDGTGDHGEVRRSTDGLTWTTAGSFPSPRHEHDAFSRAGVMWVLGGHGAATFPYSDVLRTTDGATWETTSTTLNFATDFQGAGQLGNRVVRVCGAGCSSLEVSDDFTTWTTGTVPDGGRDGPTIVTHDDKLVLVGGGSTSVYSSSDGLQWTTIGTFPVNLTRASATVFTPR
jgi:hypothetical protein